jgi:hypothetical protein
LRGLRAAGRTGQLDVLLAIRDLDRLDAHGLLTSRTNPEGRGQWRVGLARLGHGGRGCIICRAARVLYFCSRTELLAEFVTGLGRSASVRARSNARSGDAVSAIPDSDDRCGVLLVTGSVERRHEVIGSIKFVLLQRHDACGGCRIVRRRTAAMELEHGVGFVDCDDDPDGLHQRSVRHPLAFGDGDEGARRELIEGQAVAARSGLPFLWGHHVMGTPRAYKFFVKISARELNLSTPEAPDMKNKDRIYGLAD